jgi:HEAT repeat protein
VLPRDARLRSLALVGALALTTGTASARGFTWPNASEQVARSLTSADPSERRLAARRVADLPRETAILLIQRSIGDPDIEVRQELAEAAITTHLPRAGDLVIAWLADTDVRLRLAACEVIRAEATERSVAALGRVVSDGDARVRLAAARAMGASLLEAAVSPLLGHLDDPAPEVRVELARSLGRLGDARAVVPLIGKVQDSASEVRHAVARALGELRDARAVSALMLSLQDASLDVRVEAVTALGKIGSDGATLAIAPLIEQATGDPASSLAVRAAAVTALGRIGSEHAARLLVAALASDDPAQERSDVRDALVAIGPRAAPLLSATLAGATSTRTAAGAALALGALQASGELDTIVRTMQRGALPLEYGLRALAALGASAALPTVLELLGDEDPSVRLAAIEAARALLDPRATDGRAVDPVAARLKAGATVPLGEKIELVRLLGRTGSPRAESTLLTFTGSKLPSLRVAALEALGELRPTSAAVDRALFEAVDSPYAQVRLAAAQALARVARPGAATSLLARLLGAAEQDRDALGTALSGVLARATDPAIAVTTRDALRTAPEAARDALIEGLGRMRGRAALQALLALQPISNLDDRRKLAEALGGHAEAGSSLRALLGDPDASVRANAVWSLGTVGAADSAPLVAKLLVDPNVAVAGNAAAALGRIAARAKGPSLAAPALCAALSDARSYVRANALSGLRAANASCPDADAALRLLARDPADAVRLAAASYLAERAPEPASTEARALRRCESEDRSPEVAARCAAPAPPPPHGTDDVTIYVVPDGGSLPMPRAPFALVRPDGYLRLGLADRRGALFEAGVPRGTLRLAVPAPLAR